MFAGREQQPRAGEQERAEVPELPEPQEELVGQPGGGGPAARDVQPHTQVQARLPRLQHQEAAVILSRHDQVNISKILIYSKAFLSGITSINVVDKTKRKALQMNKKGQPYLEADFD